MTVQTRTCAALATLALAAALASCGGGGPDNLRVVLREPVAGARGARAVPPGTEKVRITVTGVRVHPSGLATLRDDGWVPCGGGKPARIDLLELGSDGRELCFDRVPEGSYRQVRVDLAENAADGSPPANAVVTGAGEELPLEVNGGGFGAYVGFPVGGGGTVEVVLELNPRAAVRQPPSGELVFRPDVRASATTVYGTVSR